MLPSVANTHSWTNAGKRCLLPPRRRAFHSNDFWHPSPKGRMRYAPTNTTCTGVSHTPSCQKSFPLQSLSHARPRHLPVSRRTIQSPRPHLDPAPRTPRSGLLSKKMGTSPATGHRHATANAVGARSRVCSPTTATTMARKTVYGAGIDGFCRFL